MGVINNKIELSTLGNFELVDITMKVKNFAENQNIKDGNLNIFAKGSGTSIIILEKENGLTEDLKNVIEKLIPMTNLYEHDKNWHANNGFSHIRNILTGNNISIPLINGKLELDMWQQIYLIEYDNKPRKRTVILQLIF